MSDAGRPHPLPTTSNRNRAIVCWEGFSLLILHVPEAPFSIGYFILRINRDMKLAVILVLVNSFNMATAFVASGRKCRATSLNATRRQVGRGALAAVLASLPFLPKSANADVDYSKIQDLLGNSDAAVYIPQQGAGPSPSKRPTYLTEPTQEFKDNESKSSEFKRKNLQAKKKFASSMEQLETVPNNVDALAKVLDEMRYQVQANGGLPIGITKEEVVKSCRRRKAKKFWPTTVEIA